MRVAQLVRLPEQPSAEQQAAWRRAPPGRARALKRRLRLGVVTTGLAAALLAAVWLVLGHVQPVSAATILDRLKLALGRSLTIELTGIDLGTVQLDGRILLDREPAPVAETGLAEVHVRFKSDNPEWYDLPSRLILCQTPTEAWQYGCGEAVPRGSMWDQLLSPGQDRRQFPAEYLRRDRSWADFWARPLDRFGQNPENLSFAYGDSHVFYAFYWQQRVVIEQLLRFLLPLGDGRTAEAVIAELRDSCSRMNVERANTATYVLRASGFRRLGGLDLSDPQVPDVRELVKRYTEEIIYDVAKGRIYMTVGFPPAGLYESGVRIGNPPFPRDVPQSSAEELVAWLRGHAADVEVDETNPEQWKIRVTGYPFPIDLSGFEWQREFMRQARNTLALEISYDAESGTVRSAVLKNVGQAGGQITLTVGDVKLEAAWLEPEYWVAPTSPP
jgi:hypothetical protein